MSKEDLIEYIHEDVKEVKQDLKDFVNIYRLEKEKQNDRIAELEKTKTWLRGSWSTVALFFTSFFAIFLAVLK